MININSSYTSSGIILQLPMRCLHMLLLAIIAAVPMLTFGTGYHQVIIQHAAKAGAVELNIAGLLADRLMEAGISRV